MTQVAFKVTPHQHRMLTGTRGLAALWVAFAHITYRPGYNAGFGAWEHFGWLAYIIRFDYLAVDFFFVLSGCLLYLTYRHLFEGKTTSWVIDRFYLQRLARIYPMHIVGVALIGLWHLLGIPHPIFSGQQDILFEHWPQTLAANAFLIHCWGIIPVASWNEPAWTVSAMAFVYVLFPNMVGGLKKLPDTIRANLLALTVVLALYAIGRNTIPHLGNADGTGALLRSFSFFLLGCLTARLYTNGWGKAWNWPVIFALIFGLGAAAMVVWFEVYNFPIPLFHLIYPIFMLGLLQGHGTVTRLLTNRASQFLGRISYSLYILHYPTLLLVKYLWGDTFGAWAQASPLTLLLLYPLAVAFLILPAWVATRYIERPLFKWAKERLKGSGE